MVCWIVCMPDGTTPLLTSLVFSPLPVVTWITCSRHKAAKKTKQSIRAQSKFSKSWFKLHWVCSSHREQETLGLRRQRGKTLTLYYCKNDSYERIFESCFVQFCREPLRLHPCSHETPECLAPQKNYEVFSYREPGCLSRPTFSRWEPPGTCRSSSPPRSRSCGDESHWKRWRTHNTTQQRKPGLLPLQIFFTTPLKGHNRRLLTLVFGIVEWKCLSEAAEKRRE